MNKLIIAGNGFDLAHGLPTSYNNFMDAFWRDLKENQDDNLVKELVHLNSEYKGFLETEIHNYKDFTDSLINYMKEYKRVDFAGYSIKVYNSFGSRYVTYKLFEFKNSFFYDLNEKKNIDNWVDVENEYYQALKEICKTDVFSVRKKREKVLKLHKEFEQVKQLLERYLQKNVVEAYDFNNISNREEIDAIMKPNESSDKNFKLMAEFSSKEDKNEIKSFMRIKDSMLNRSKKSLILNFNYTPTFENYIEANFLSRFGLRINHIHGELNKNIVFGFGDEMDDDYKLIEDMDDNEYLKYFKSFQYVQNSNYKDILRYIDSEKFQVIIMGHSCGLSDRTLLNTIFEHENCRSIKVYYYKNGDYDNYTEIIQNISRHFNDKKLMRTKIVEKTLCEPMPQIQLPKNK